MQKEHLILDTLNDIKNIILYYSETIDYTIYIKELNKTLSDISDMLSRCESEEDFERISGHQKRAEMYLSAAKSMQKQYEQSKEAQESMEK